MNEINYLLGKTALVTASSRGIGRAIAMALARQGAKVVVNYKNDQSAADEVVAEIEKLGSEAIAIQADVSKAEPAEQLVKQAHQHFGRLDILVNNAGPFQMQTLSETTIDDWHAMIDGNLNSAFYCTHHALPIMKEQGRGDIIFIGCVKADSQRARQNNCAYGIAKTGVVLLAKTLAREEGANGIRANVINPGVIDNGTVGESELQQYARHISMGEIGQTDDIANAVLFFLSDQGRYCNGAILNVDGGLWL